MKKNKTILYVSIAIFLFFLIFLSVIISYKWISKTVLRHSIINSIPAVTETEAESSTEMESQDKRTVIPGGIVINIKDKNTTNKLYQLPDGTELQSDGSDELGSKFIANGGDIYYLASFSKNKDGSIYITFLKKDQYKSFLATYETTDETLIETE